MLTPRFACASIMALDGSSLTMGAKMFSGTAKAKFSVLWFALVFINLDWRCMEAPIERVLSYQRSSFSSSSSFPPISSGNSTS